MTPSKPGDLEPVEPVRRLLRVAGRGRDVERQRLHLRPPLLERLAVEVLAVPEEDVEETNPAGISAESLLDAALGRMEPHLERVEVEARPSRSMTISPSSADAAAAGSPSSASSGK